MRYPFVLFPAVCCAILLSSCNQQDKDKLNERVKTAEGKLRNAVDTVRDRIDSRMDTGTASRTDNPSPATADRTNVHSYDVTLDDYSIEVDDQLAAGNVEFKVTNQGKMDHNFEILGNGIKRSFTPNLKPDETRVLQLALRPGTYEILCPLDGHRGKGMDMKVTAK